MMVLMPIWRNSAQCSRMPPLTMSRRSMTPMHPGPSATTSGVAPERATSSTSSLTSDGQLPPASSAKRRTASTAPLRSLRPCRSRPLMRVWAENSWNLGCRWRDPQGGGPASASRDRRSSGPPVSHRPARRALPRPAGRERRFPEPLKRHGTPVTARDRSRLVEHQYVDVGGGLHRADRGRDDVGAHQPCRADDADREHACTNSDRNGTHDQRDDPRAYQNAAWRSDGMENRCDAQKERDRCRSRAISTDGSPAG